jgi:hypothetical protein
MCGQVMRRSASSRAALVETPQTLLDRPSDLTIKLRLGHVGQDVEGDREHLLRSDSTYSPAISTVRREADGIIACGRFDAPSLSWGQIHQALKT